MLLRALLSIPDVGQIDAFVEPWRRLYAQSPLLSTLILFGHLGGLLAAGGLAVAAERVTLRLDPTDDLERRRHLADLERLRAPIWSAFGVALVSGALLFFADVEAFATSPIFWTKMSLVGLLIATTLRHGARWMPRSGATATPARPTASRGSASGGGAAAAPAPSRPLLLWFGLVLVGAALASH